MVQGRTRTSPAQRGTPERLSSSAAEITMTNLADRTKRCVREPREPNTQKESSSNSNNRLKGERNQSQDAEQTTQGGFTLLDDTAASKKMVLPLRFLNLVLGKTDKFTLTTARLSSVDNVLCLSFWHRGYFGIEDGVHSKSY